jgi:hypothetical protein
MGNNEVTKNINNKSRVPTHFANILMTNDHPMGRIHAPKRKKGDWYHSISVFAHESIDELPVGGSPVDCVIIHFFGEDGSPVLSYLSSTIKCTKTHIGKKLYEIDAWSTSTCVIGDIRTNNGYECGHGSSIMTIVEIVTAAINKWGDEKIPYTHQRNESYNCVAFVDDILHWASHQKWNPRIVDMHAKHGLCL